jgi:hypothetical protein
LFAQQQQEQLPIMHLRELNPLVGSVLEAAAAANAARLRSFHMPRQAGPAVLIAGQQGDAAGFRTGISAFAFQGELTGKLHWHQWLFKCCGIVRRWGVHWFVLHPYAHRYSAAAEATMSLVCWPRDFCHLTKVDLAL